MAGFRLMALLCLSTALAAPVYAQEAPEAQGADEDGGLGEIIVTAQRRQESAQSVPVAVSVVKSDLLVERGGNIADIAQLVPGVQANSFTDRENVAFAIRGQQYTFGTLFPSVISYFADVPLIRLSTGQTFDMGSVQVLKGPQGTLFGRVTNGGAILLTPQAPTNEYGGWVEGRVGNYDQRQVTGAVNVPLVDDKILARLAFDVNRRDGYTFNEYNDKWLDEVSYEGIRFSLLVKPADWLENSTIINYNHSSTSGTGTVLTGFNPNALAYAGNSAFIPAFQAALDAQKARRPYHTYVGVDLPDGADDDGILYRREALFAVNTTKIQLSDKITLKNIFGYVYNKEVRADDYDAVGGVKYVSQSVTRDMRPRPDGYYDQFSEELQLQGTLFDDRLDFTVGGYLDRQGIPGRAGGYSILFESAQSGNSVDRVTKSRAVYGQIGYDLSSFVEGVKLNAGIRYTHDTVKSRESTVFVFSLDPAAVPPVGTCLSDVTDYPSAILILPCTEFKNKSKVVTYNLGLDWQITPDIFTYVSQRRGYRPGGINANVQNGVVVPGYDPEYTISREFGIKADWNIGPIKMRTNLAAFRDSYRDIQQQLQVLNPDGNPYTSLVNATKAKIQGIELDVTAIPVTGLTLTGSWAYLDAKYSKAGFTEAQLATVCPADPLTTASDPTMGCPLDPIPQTPKNTVRLAFDYVLPLSEDIGKISFGGDMYYISSNFINGRHIPSGTMPARTLYNASIRWREVMGKPIDLSFFVNNLTDKLYYSSIDSVMAVGEFGRIASYYGPPRMYGLSVKVSY